MQAFVIICHAALFWGCDGSEHRSALNEAVAVVQAQPTPTEASTFFRGSHWSTLSAACSDTAALLLARAVILAAPIIITDKDIFLNNGEPLRQFVASFRRYFEPNGPAVRCAAVAGPRLFRMGIQTYDRNAYDRVMSSAPAEIAHLSQDIANRINSSSLNMFELGQELSWLSQVLPSIANGELGPFFNTGYPIRNYKRQQITLAWPSLQQMCAMGDCREILSLALPQVRQMVDEVGLGMIYAMVMMAG